MYEIIGPRHSYTITKADLVLLAMLAVWEIIWKGMALWHAGKNKQLGWFVVMLLLNTVGILEIVYLSFFQAKSKD